MKTTDEKKVTFTTLKSLAKKGKLTHKVTREFDGMTDGLEGVANQIDKITTLEDIAGFKVTKNYLSVEGNKIRLSNCCFTVIFTVSN
jgi:hypothetical protein